MRRIRMYFFFWLGLLFMQVIAILKLLFEPETGFEINIYNTYHRVSQYSFYQMLAVIFFIIGLGYWVLHKSRKRVNRPLAMAHLMITMGVLLLMSLLNISNGSDDTTESGIPIIMMLLLTIVLVAQLLYIFNILSTAVSPRHHHRHRHRYDSDIEG